MLISYNFHEIWIKHVLWFLDGSFICQTFLFLFIYYNLHNRHSIYGDLDSITANLFVDRPKPCSLTGILLQNVIRSSSLSSTSPLLSNQAPGHVCMYVNCQMSFWVKYCHKIFLVLGRLYIIWRKSWEMALSITTWNPWKSNIYWNKVEKHI